jgi:glycosyltransferase involved in cell wall biosynthesis
VKADVLLSVGNFALWNCPIRQILLSRNALYTSSDFERDLKRRGDYRLWIDNAFKAEIARASIRIAQVTVAPSQSFAEELRQWSGVPVEAIYHGFDKSLFWADSKPIPREMEESAFRPEGALRLLFVSHYNYYRNFETLFRAIALLKNLLAPRTVRLFLTCHLRENANPGSYRTGDASALVRDLRISENLVELGAVSYYLLHHVYSKADFYVTPAYCESFAHPLIEAMSTGIPIVASDIPVHREICRDSAVYFDRFSAGELAQAVVQLANSRSSVERLSAAGLQRSQEFSWISHLDNILSLANRVVAPSASKV